MKKLKRSYHEKNITIKEKNTQYSLKFQSTFQNFYISCYVSNCRFTLSSKINQSMQYA